MMHTGWSRTTRRAIWAVVVAFCAMVIPAAGMPAAQASDTVAHGARSNLSAHASEHGRTRILGFDDDRTTVMPGQKVSDQVVVLPKARRTILVQSRKPGSTRFVTQSAGSSSATGRFRAVYRPTSGGAWLFRLVVKSTHSRRGVTSAARLVTVLDKTAPPAVPVLDTTAPASVTGLKVSEVTLDSATLSWVNPQDADFTGVMIRRSNGATAPATPTAGTLVGDASRSLTSFKDTGLTNNTTYSYSVFTHDASSNFGPVASLSLHTTRTAVTGLEVTSVDRTTVALAWTNPADADFTGVVIRRQDGATPPVSATDGTRVGDVPAPANTLSDTNLTPGQQYTYAAFAHDAAGHVAPAATLTITTKKAGTSAALSVNPLPSVHTGDRVTVDTAVAFDGSESLPAMGAYLTAWTIDYGDHISDAFNGRLSTVDVLNTKHTFTNTGPHTVRLTVTDSAGKTASTTLRVDVFDAPEVSIEMSDESPEAEVAVPFEVKAKTPEDTAITSYRLEVAGDDSFFLDGDSAPPTSQTITFDSGSYTVVLSMTNDAGGTAVSDPVDVEVP